MIVVPCTPEQITGIETDSDIILFNSISKPLLVPSISIEVINISPAPRLSSSFDQDKTSILVCSLPLS